ncbi:universal stress protein [Natronolimnobius sp. AArcel1]|uniref:universal stress protein n=1 Tax=Natronolimnobius sp. AArcel1 TaxID=1679093 RepID=UPI0013EDB169|nr:universal stress protein [Natronolimnobius sp. AArcel1]NGM69290.1 universal stress protein [Natronolimnobius sp. AArcel1]
MPIVAAVDQSERAAIVVEQAADLAKKYETELHVLHVGHPTSDFTEVSADAMREKHEITAKSTIEKTQKAATAVAREIAEMVDGLEETDYEPVGLVGDPAEVIRSYATEHDAKYIVVCGRHRRPIGQALFGSVTQALLLNANRPVVAVPYEETET